MAITLNIHCNLNGWSPLIYAVGNRVTSGGNAYQCTFPGSSTSAPTGNGSAINNGGVAVFKWLSAVDFATLPAAIAALPSAFTQPITWAFWNNGTILTSGTSPFMTLTGHTTTSTNNLTLTCAPGESIRDALHGGHTALAFNAAAGVSFTLPASNPGFHVDYFDIFDAFVVFDGLQIKNPSATNGCSILAVEPGASGFTLSNCVLDFVAQPNMTQLGFYEAGYVIRNSLVVDRQAAAGGQIGVKAEAPGAFVNCTAVAPNSPAGVVFIVSDVTSVGADPFTTDFTTAFGPVGPVTVRNCACFGYPAGIANSVVVGGAVVIDHSATDAATLGNANTDAGGNLLNQSAITNLVSLASDARLILGAAVVNLGATDTGDIPSGDDIAKTSRPQGAAWDIGAWELPALRLRGTAVARSRSLLSQALGNRGTGRSAGRAVLIVTATAAIWSGRGRANASGKSAAQYTQSTFVIDPWSADFSTAFGPTTSVAAAISMLHGQASASGRAVLVGPTAPSARGQGRSSARSAIKATASLQSGQTASRAYGRAGGSFVQAGGQAGGPWSVDFSTAFGPLSGATIFAGRATGRATSRSGPVFIQSVAVLSGPWSVDFSIAFGPLPLGVPLGRSLSASKGRAACIATAKLVAKGSAKSRGKATPPPTKAVLVTRGLARAAAISTGLYTAPSSANRGGTISRAGAAITASLPLQALGTAASAGNLLYNNNALILNVRGSSQSSATGAPMSQTAAPSAAGVAGAFGRSQINIAQPVSAVGKATSRSTTALVYNGLLPSVGRSTVAGSGALTLTASIGSPSVDPWSTDFSNAFGPLAAAALGFAGTGRARAFARSLLVRTVSLRASARSALSARGVIGGTLPLAARGFGQTSGQNGSNTSSRPLTGLAIAAARALTSLRITDAAVGSSQASTAGTAAGLFRYALGALGTAGAKALTQIMGTALLRAAGTSRAATTNATPTMSTALLALGSAAGLGAGSITQQVFLSALGTAALSGQAFAAAPLVALSARGISFSNGRAVGLGFAPVALVGSGRSGATAAARVTANIALLGTTIGFSAGRCASTQSVLLMASGRGRTAGQTAAAMAVGFTAGGVTRSSGRLFTRHLIDGLGHAVSQSQSRLSGAFNVTPDVAGPRLSTIGALPAFDAMDLSDVDFFSFDWSARASVLGDPIISATVTASPSGMAVGSVVVAGSIVQVRVTAGSMIETFSLRCSVTLRSGRILHWSAAVAVADF